MTKNEAERWLAKHPLAKQHIDDLQDLGILARLETRVHRRGAEGGNWGAVDLIDVAQAAGYKTGRDVNPRARRRRVGSGRPETRGRSR